MVSLHPLFLTKIRQKNALQSPDPCIWSVTPAVIIAWAFYSPVYLGKCFWLCSQSDFVFLTCVWQRRSTDPCPDLKMRLTLQNKIYSDDSNELQPVVGIMVMHVSSQPWIQQIVTAEAEISSYPVQQRKCDYSRDHGLISSKNSQKTTRSYFITASREQSIAGEMYGKTIIYSWKYLQYPLFFGISHPLPFTLVSTWRNVRSKDCHFVILSRVKPKDIL